jgi:ABC-type uncharacterized transport system YnjBCD ATPase subunit
MGLHDDGSGRSAMFAPRIGALKEKVPATGPICMGNHMAGHMHTRRVRLGPAGWDLGGFVPFGSI